MGIQTRKTAGPQTKAQGDPGSTSAAAESLLGYYRVLDVGATRWVMDQAAASVCDHLHPVVLTAALRLIRRRTGLRGNAAVQAAEEVSQLVLSNLLTRVKAGSPVRRFDPAKSDLGAFVWVLVD
ncbi:MAG: hypothetical protein ACKOS8_04660, partial [Gemmataceae bacterium]